MSEQRILAAALQDRGSYDIIAESLSEGEITPLGDELLGYMGKLYAASPRIKRLDVDGLNAWIKDTCPNPKHVGDFVDMVTELPFVDSPQMVASIIREQKLRALRMKLAGALQANDPDLSDLLVAYEELSAPEDVTGPLLSDRESFLATFEEISSENRIRLWPKRLQENTGGALPGHHIVLYGRPERGKTLLCVNMVAGFLYDQLPVLYVGNEDPVSSIKARIASRLVGVEVQDFINAPGDFYDRAVARGLGHLHVERLDPGSVGEIESLIRKHKPAILVVDQLRNLNTRGGKGENITNRIDQAAQEVRTLLGKYDLLGISVAQAGAGEYGQNDNKAFLDISDIDSSKTGLPGAADLLIGIGATEEMVTNNTRGLSLVKNKLNGNHARFLVRLDIQRNRVE